MVVSNSFSKIMQIYVTSSCGTLITVNLILKYLNLYYISEHTVPGNSGTYCWLFMNVTTSTGID